MTARSRGGNRAPQPESASAGRAQANTRTGRVLHTGSLPTCSSQLGPLVYQTIRPGQLGTLLAPVLSLLE